MSILYDNIIIGAGISGLVLNYYLKCNNIVLEKQDRIGGRIYPYFFHEVQIQLGGGMYGRESDKLLIALLHDLDIPIKMKDKLVPVIDNYTYLDFVSIQKIIRYLKNYEKDEGISVGQVLSENFTKEEIDKFFVYTGFTDFVNQDVQSFINNYDISDIFDMKGIIFEIDWNLVLSKLSSKNNIVTSCYITNIEIISDNTILIKDNKNNTYRCKKVIISGTLSDITGLNISDKQRKIDLSYLRSMIREVPFVKIFSYHSNKVEDNERIQHKDNSISKIIPIHETNIRKLVYADEENALYWTDPIFQDRNYLIDHLTRLSGYNDIEDIIKIFWKCGVHTYLPGYQKIDSLEIVKDKIYMMGECVSENQGWVESALTTVVDVLNLIQENE